MADSSSISLSAEVAAWRSTRGYVENVAAAIVAASLDDRACGRTYNVGEEDPLSEADWARAIARAAGWQGEIRTVESSGEGGFDWNQQVVVSTRRLREELAFEEPISRAEGLRRTVTWERVG